MDMVYQSIPMQKISQFLHHILIDITDKRTINWPLMRDPTWICLIVWTYVCFVTSWGPKFMKNREPFEMKKFLIIYNFAHVLFSAWLSYAALFEAFLFGTYSLECEPVHWGRSVDAMVAARGCYWYFLAKVSELLDTVFFILRKKEKQVSFLHVFHHSGMVFIAYGVTKYYPGGNVVFYGMLNSMVHTVMYLYYMISAMGPEYQKYLWWKKYMTKIQMIQFFLAVLHASQLLYTDCGFPRWTIILIVPNLFALYLLFHDFYKQAYINIQASKKLDEKNVSNKKYSFNISEYQNAHKSTGLLKPILMMYAIGLGIFIFGYDMMQSRNMELMSSILD